ncbi:hypothetical protein ACJMK2_012791 [Sinanodonta woodiana]|uniref:Uncharacterized protein n=1 Tax=Sinanodonta woodiana TaxID=1069815 RepID=A0ABD3VCC9_SINWO
MDETTYRETDSEKIIPMVRVMQDATEICHLAHIARLWAREAEIRERYSLTFAEKVISQASSSLSVATSLERTSRIVASLASDLAARTKVGSDMCDDDNVFVDRNMDETYSIFEQFRHARDNDMYIIGNDLVKPDDNIGDKEDSLLSKSPNFTETFPKYTASNLGAEFDSLSALAPIWEQSDDFTWAYRPNKTDKWQEAKNIKKLQMNMDSITISVD